MAVKTKAKSVKPRRYVIMFNDRAEQDIYERARALAAQERRDLKSVVLRALERELERGPEK